MLHHTMADVMRKTMVTLVCPPLEVPLRRVSRTFLHHGFNGQGQHSCIVKPHEVMCKFDLTADGDRKEYCSCEDMTLSSTVVVSLKSCRTAAHRRSDGFKRQILIMPEMCLDALVPIRLNRLHGDRTLPKTPTDDMKPSPCGRLWRR
jgi:hypothetical protein